MSKEVRVHLADDLDGTLIGEGEGESVRFALNGTTWEIDLTNEHIAELKALLQPYMEHGRKLRIGGMTSWRDVESVVTSGRNDMAAVRQWARENGLKVSDKGRISAKVLAAYDARDQASGS